MQYIKKWIKSLIINFYFILTAFFFSSMEVYLGNIAEFTFPAKHVWWIMLAVSIAAAVSLSLIEGLLKKEVLDVVLTLTAALGICIYVQSLFMNGHLQELNGEETAFERTLIIYNAVVWLGIAFSVSAFLMIVRKRAGEEKYNEAVILMSVGLVVIQWAGLISTCVSVDPLEADKNTYLSTAGEFELSDKDNVIFFILDNCDGVYVKEALQQDPDLFKEFDGFVYYPDAISKYSRTYPAVPYLFTHEFCDFSKPYTQYVSDAFENSDYLEEINNAGADIRIYTSLNYLAQNSYGLVNNISVYDSESFNVLSVRSLIKAMLRLGGYRAAPYLLKPVFSYTVDPINRNVMSGLPEDYYTLTNNDFDFHERLLAEKISVDSSKKCTFRFYHLFGPHPGCYMNADAGYDNDATQTEALRGDIKILGEYMRFLKEAGIYDKSTIIITADHGNQNESDDLTLHAAPTCIMLVKKSGADSEEVIVSKSPVCHDDVFAAVLSGFGISGGNYNESIFYIPENADRVRYYYYTSQRNWTDGEVDLKEYEIFGDANDFNSWKQTGKSWKIYYSANSVARR